MSETSMDEGSMSEYAPDSEEEDYEGKEERRDSNSCKYVMAQVECILELFQTCSSCTAKNEVSHFVPIIHYDRKREIYSEIEREDGIPGVIVDRGPHSPRSRQVFGL